MWINLYFLQKKKKRKIFTAKVHMLGEKKEKINENNLYRI